MGKKAKKVEEKEQQIVEITRAAQSKCNRKIQAKQDSNKISHTIDGVKVTMISSSNGGSDDEALFDCAPSELLNNDESPPFAQLQHNLTLLANMSMMMKDEELVPLPTGSHIESTGNDIPPDDLGFEQNSILFATLNI
eukprot:5770716-Ditylum_brightwellii.AAC.1